MRQYKNLIYKTFNDTVKLTVSSTTAVITTATIFFSKLKNSPTCTKMGCIALISLLITFLFKLSLSIPAALRHLFIKSPDNIENSKTYGRHIYARTATNPVKGNVRYTNVSGFAAGKTTKVAYKQTVIIQIPPYIKIAKAALDQYFIPM